MQTAKRVAVNTGFLYARMAITVFISLYATRLILNALGAADFGLFNVIGGAIVMLTFLNNAMASSTQRYMSFAQGEGNTEKQKSIFNVSIILHFIIAILVVLLLEVAGYFFFKGIFNIPADRIDVAKLIFQFLLISTFFTIISVPYDAVINAHENMFLVAVLGIIEAVLKLAIAIYITNTTFDKLIAYGFLMTLLSILLLIMRRIYCHRKYLEVKINLKKYISKPLFIEMTHFAGWSFLGSASSMISNYGQGIVMNMFFGTLVNAAQGIANQVSGQLGAFASTMIKALNPLIAKSEGSGNRELMIKASMMGSKVSFFLLMFFYIPVLIEMPFIFKLWLKVVPENAQIFCTLLLIRMLIEQLFITLTSSIAAVGKIKRFQLYNSILNFSPLIAGFLLFKIGYPPYFIYIVFIIYSILNSVIILHFARKDCSLSILFFFKNVISRCLVAFFITIIISASPIFLMDEGIERLIIVIGINTIIFTISVLVIGLSRSERLNILSMVKIEPEKKEIL
ncbi:MAG: hypothetical protein Q8R96_05835 [Bacteroidota bacterium]|nr:hypothetical protein [Bacteroidota bacterium]